MKRTENQGELFEDSEYQTRALKLASLLNQSGVEIDGDLNYEGITIGIVGQKPLVRLVPCLNPKVKCPIGLYYDQVDPPVYRLVNLILCDEINALRSGGRDTKELNPLNAINYMLHHRYDFTAVASGMKGSRITMTGTNEHAFGFDSGIVAKIHSDGSVAGSIEVNYRGRSYWVTLPHAASVDAPNDAWVAFANGIVPSVHSFVWSEELKSRKKTGTHG